MILKNHRFLLIYGALILIPSFIFSGYADLLPKALGMPQHTPVLVVGRPINASNYWNVLKGQTPAINPIAPGTQSTPSTESFSHDQQTIKHFLPRVWIITDLDDLPSPISTLDRLDIKKNMDRAYTERNVIITRIQFFIKAQTGNPTCVYDSKNYSNALILIKGSDDDITNAYYSIEKLPVGQLICKLFLTKGLEQAKTQLIVEQEIEVVTASDPRLTAVAQGDDGSL